MHKKECSHHDHIVNGKQKLRQGFNIYQMLENKNKIGYFLENDQRKESGCDYHHYNYDNVKFEYDKENHNLESHNNINKKIDLEDKTKNKEMEKE